MKQHNKKENMLIMGVVTITIVITGIYLYGNFEFEKTYDKKSEDFGNQDFYSEEKCRCFEKQRAKCPDNYEFIEERKLCVNENLVTNPALACSKYECSGEVYSFDSGTGEWSRG